MGARERGPGRETRRRPFPRLPKAETFCRAPRLPSRALAVSGSLCAPGASGVELRGDPGPGHSAPDAGQGRRSARAVPASRRGRRGGAGGAWAGPRGRRGGRRPARPSAPEEGSRHKSARPAPATQWPRCPHGAPSPAARPRARLHSHLGNEGRWSTGIQIFCTRL